MDKPGALNSSSFWKSLQKNRFGKLRTGDINSEVGGFVSIDINGDACYCGVNMKIDDSLMRDVEEIKGKYEKEIWGW